MVKYLPTNVGDSDSIPGSERSPRGGHGNPLQDTCLENPHGQRILAGYSPWDCKESDMTESAYHARMEGKSTSGRPTSKQSIMLTSEKKNIDSKDISAQHVAGLRCSAFLILLLFYRKV